MESKVYGYVRVSSKEQNEDRQLDALQENGVPPEQVYVDKQSGKDFARPGYRRLLSRLRRGDLLIIKSIDRLGRNYQEIMEQWRVITKEKHADIRVLDMPLLDTTLSRDLLGTFISDLVLQLLSFVAENERNSIRQRQAEGIAAARARGVKFGRPRKDLPVPFDTVAQRWQHKELHINEAVEMLGICKSTFFRLLREQRTGFPATVYPPPSQQQERA
ncbi:recombinase family protein [Intestinibacillus massiliensis]|uniref:recombinase family protein n=1 Tax=Intestinibacillus massiliensis TaxID=1871029 RepID=UPI000B34AFC1|nr:recombinase family protein [Intestinibacillus massiliensis]MCB6365047.1 recombinase family protein [Intestinibacillus massiliensis]